MRKPIIVIAIVAAVAAAGVAVWRQAPAEPADLVLVNGKVVTLEDAQAEAQAIAIRGDRILAIGSTADMKRHTGPNTETIDLQGQLVIPGFIEGHGHFMGVGRAEMQLKLMDTKSWDEIVQMVAEAAKTAKPGQWITGRGWHQEKWTAAPEPNVEGFPLHASLDAVSPNNPVMLTHASGHASFANGMALKLSGVTRDTPDPAGGEILRDAKGTRPARCARPHRG
jgi:predicted amidohydrolase YtcJ